MHLLYLDDSGSVPDPRQKYFIIAEFSTFERQSYWLANGLDNVIAKHSTYVPPEIELHGFPMLQGANEWKGIPQHIRLEILTESLGVLANSLYSNRVFGVAVLKAKSPKDPVEFCFEQLCNRFDRYLRRLHLRGDTQRGLNLFDKHAKERSIQNLATDFRQIGHSWGVVTNLADVPVFMDSKASRLIQLADLVAYSMFRHFERGDSRFRKWATCRGIWRFCPFRSGRCFGQRRGRHI